jgi:hypothetical protein
MLIDHPLPSRPLLSLLLVATVALGSGGALGADWDDRDNLPSGGRIIGDPKACEGSQLCFEWPPLQKGMAYPGVKSRPFFVVILRSGNGCFIPEAERVAAQALFPARKVFSHRSLTIGCQDPEVDEDGINYRNIDDTKSVLAVYAGPSRKSGLKTLAEVKATGRFPGANLRQTEMAVSFP